MSSRVICVVDSSSARNTDIICFRGGKIKRFVEKVDSSDKVHDGTVPIFGGYDSGSDLEPKTVVDK